MAPLIGKPLKPGSTGYHLFLREYDSDKGLIEKKAGQAWASLTSVQKGEWDARAHEMIMEGSNLNKFYWDKLLKVLNEMKIKGSTAHGRNVHQFIKWFFVWSTAIKSKSKGTNLA